MANRESFYDIISAAIADMSFYGFDSVERLERWLIRIRSAAEDSLTPASTLERVLNERMRSIFEKTVERGHVLKLHPGVSRYTVEKLKPAMRLELDKRIVANANLIKLNRAEAINKTLHRFSGWATSIPKGGLAEPKKREASQNIRKSLTQLKWENRRVEIDQAAKLTAAISDVIARDGDAIAMFWHSHWRQAGYNYRPDHRERDLKCYMLKGNWAQTAGFAKVGSAGYYDDITQVAQEPFCRCFASFAYSLRDLPPEMLTARGKSELMRVRVAA